MPYIIGKTNTNFLAFLIFTILIITSCGHAVEDVSKMTPKPPEEIPTVITQLNDQLKSAQTNSLGMLQSYVQIDDSEVLPMVLSNNSAQFSINLPNLDKTKPHNVTVSLTYTLNSNTNFPLQLGTASQNPHDFNSDPNVIFNAIDINTSADQDLDGMSNLDELLVGGNPFNPAPTFTTPAIVSVKEGQAIVLKVEAIAPNSNATLSYSVTGGVDQSLFIIDSVSGALSFIIAPIYNDPTQGRINDYDVQVTVSDGTLSLSQSITVTVTDLFDLKVTIAFKHLQFNWSPYPGAAYYKIKEFPNGSPDIINELKTSGGSPNLQGPQFNYEFSVHLFDQANALYQLEAYNDSDALIKASAPISVIGNLADAVGYFKANDTAPSDFYGAALDLSADGQTLAVGARSTTSGVLSHPGAVYVYTRETNGDWPAQGVKLQANEPLAGDWFGTRLQLSTDGQTLIVYAPNGVNKGVYIFDRDTNGNWPLQGVKLQTNDPGFGYQFSLSIDGQTLVVSAPYADIGNIIGAGVVYVFTRDSNGNWPLQGITLQASDPGAYNNFGQILNLSADGKTLAIGVPNATIDTFLFAGAVYLFNHDANSNWIPLGIKLQGTNPSIQDNYGDTISLSGNGQTLAVRATGTVYVYTRNTNGDWPTQGTKLFTNEGGSVGVSLTISENGQILIVGAPTSTVNGIDAAGLVYIFTRDANGNWPSQGVKLQPNDTNSGGQFGEVLSLSADNQTLVVGAPFTDVGTINDAGAAYVFKRNINGTWPLLGVKLQASDPTSTIGDNFGDYFGYHISLSANGKTLVIGAEVEDSSATGFNPPIESQKDNSAQDSGAVYMY